jgi:uncharacterized membrane protein
LRIIRYCNRDTFNESQKYVLRPIIQEKSLSLVDQFISFEAGGEIMQPGDDSGGVTTVDQKQQSNSENEIAKMAPRWAALVGILATGVLYTFLPQRLRIGPSWLLLAIEVVTLLPLVFILLTRDDFSQNAIRIYVMILLGIVTLALAISILLLVISLPKNKQATDLLGSAAVLWSVNILVFGLWYWEIDGGGPAKRHQSGHQAADFMFPQQANGNDGSWAPHFLDYLFVAFTGSTALSPADTYPLTRPAKTLMMIEAILSLTIIVLLAARAINILGS